VGNMLLGDFGYVESEYVILACKFVVSLKRWKKHLIPMCGCLMCSFRECPTSYRWLS